jgi:hypothetical protein
MIIVGVDYHPSVQQVAFCAFVRDYLGPNERRARAGGQQFDEAFPSNAASDSLSELDPANNETVDSTSN